MEEGIIEMRKFIGCITIEDKTIRVTKKSTILKDHNNRSIQQRIDHPLYINPIGLFVLHLARYMFKNKFSLVNQRHIYGHKWIDKLGHAKKIIGVIYVTNPSFPHPFCTNSYALVIYYPISNSSIIQMPHYTFSIIY